MLIFTGIYIINQSCSNSPAHSKKQSVTDSADAALLAAAQSNFPVLPDTMPGAYADTKEKTALGKALYSETLLSVNGKQSCNSCHPLDNAGADHEITGLGALGKHGRRNDPSTFNAGFQRAQFWDGRAATLEEQVKGPLFNPVEMAMPNEKTLLARLKKNRDYAAKFANAFPADAVTLKNLAAALASFQRTLISKGHFDRYLAGDVNALNAEEKKGLNMFMNLRCTNCHFGPNLGGEMFQKIGFFNPYKNKDDLGRYEITKQEGDRYVFKVPMLRNVALTGPYFHDGSIKTLDEAVHQMGHLQLNKKLTDEQVKYLVAFLGSLTDEKYLYIR